MCNIIREYISAWGVLSGVNEILENMLTMLVNLEVRKTGVKQVLPSLPGSYLTPRDKISKHREQIEASGFDKGTGKTKVQIRR